MTELTLLIPLQEGLVRSVLVDEGSLVQAIGKVTISWPVEGIESSGLRIRVIGE